MHALCIIMLLYTENLEFFQAYIDLHILYMINHCPGKNDSHTYTHTLSCCSTSWISKSTGQMRFFFFFFTKTPVSMKLSTRPLHGQKKSHQSCIKPTTGRRQCARSFYWTSVLTKYGGHFAKKLKWFLFCFPYLSLLLFCLISYMCLYFLCPFLLFTVSSNIFTHQRYPLIVALAHMYTHEVSPNYAVSAGECGRCVSLCG